MARCTLSSLVILKDINVDVDCFLHSNLIQKMCNISKHRLDILVDKILAKNANKNPSLVISILKLYGIEAKHICKNKYKITNTFKWFHQAEENACQIKNFLIDFRCLNIKKISVYAYKCLFSGKSISEVTFEV